jgi:sugar-phosphatase
VALRVSLRCAAILFDLDGVLVDSAACVERTWRNWALSHHLEPERVIAVAHGRRALETVQMLVPDLSSEAELAALAASESTTTEGVLEVPGARALLRRLPVTNWAIVTSGIRAVATFRLTHTNLPQPAVMFCADDVQRGKPDPEGYLSAAQRLGFAPHECVVVEDAPAGLEAAKAAGMRSIAVLGTYGAGDLALADYTIRDVTGMTVSVGRGSTPVEIHLAIA